MSEGSTVVSRAVRLRTAFKVLGSVYLAYHGLAASWLMSYRRARNSMT